MATYYVYSGAAGAGTGADWANAFTTLAGAFSGKAAGDIFYVADDHAESQASAMTLTTPGTVASPCRVICVSRSGSVPPVSADLRTTATVTTTGANAITFGGQHVYYYGVTFNAATGANASGITSTNAGVFVFERCVLAKKSTTASSSALNFAGNGNFTRLVNSAVEFGNVGDGISAGGRFEWIGTSNGISGAVVPTTGLFAAPSLPSSILIEGVDLSVLGSSSTLFRALVGMAKIVLKDVKLGSSVTIAATPGVVPPDISVIRCDSGDTNYRSERYQYQGTLTTETTIVRTGGASDGATPIAWKVVTTVNPEIFYPFECFPITIWNETVGSSITVTVECRGAAVPNNDEVWMDVEYLGTSGFPLGNFATTEIADILATPAACTSSSETWGGGTSSFKLQATITPQEKGPITCYVKIAKASSTFYIDPKITIT